MNLIEKQEYYAKMLLTKVMNVRSNQSLLIIGEYENYEFIRMLAKEALSMGIVDIGFDIHDEHIKASMYEKLTVENLKEQAMFNRDKYDEYALKNGAILHLCSEHFGLTDHIDANVISQMRTYSATTYKKYVEKRNENELKWCIAALPNIEWAKKIFPKSINPLEDLWEALFDICCINEENPNEEIDKLMELRAQKAMILNDLKLKRLIIKNKLGTDITMDLIENSIWNGGYTTLNNGDKIIVNFPSYEIFTSPSKYNVNGKFISSMPLIVSGVLIDNIQLDFVNGRVVSVKADNNVELLQDIIFGNQNSDYLGEIALVDYNSPIRNTGRVYYNTLIDENASAHFAVGNGFTKCVPGSSTLSDCQKDALGLNVSSVHLDIMFGTNDLNIKGITQSNEEVEIFVNGNFSKKLIKRKKN